MPEPRGSDLGDGLSVLTWVSISSPRNGDASVVDNQEEDEEHEVVYLPVECGICLGTRTPNDKIVASTQHPSYNRSGNLRLWLTYPRHSTW